jgi:hypothetical protein
MGEEELVRVNWESVSLKPVEAANGPANPGIWNFTPPPIYQSIKHEDL